MKGSSGPTPLSRAGSASSGVGLAPPDGRGGGDGRCGGDGRGGGSGPDRRCEASPAEFRLGRRTVPALLRAVGARRGRLSLRETDALAARDVSVEEAEIADRARGVATGDTRIAGTGRAEAGIAGTGAAGAGMDGARRAGAGMAARPGEAVNDDRGTRGADFRRSAARGVSFEAVWTAVLTASGDADPTSCREAYETPPGAGSSPETGVTR